MIGVVISLIFIFKSKSSTDFDKVDELIHPKSPPLRAEEDILNFLAAFSNPEFLITFTTSLILSFLFSSVISISISANLYSVSLPSRKI